MVRYAKQLKWSNLSFIRLEELDSNSADAKKNIKTTEIKVDKKAEVEKENLRVSSAKKENEKKSILNREPIKIKPKK